MVSGSLMRTPHREDRRGREAETIRSAHRTADRSDGREGHWGQPRPTATRRATPTLPFWAIRRPFRVKGFR